MVNLKEALNTGKLNQFIKEHKNDPDGDTVAFNRIVEAMAQKSSKARPASPQDGSGD